MIRLSRILVWIVAFCCFGYPVFSQTGTDTLLNPLPETDSLLPQPAPVLSDSVSRRPVSGTWSGDWKDARQRILEIRQHHPYYGWNAPLTGQTGEQTRRVLGKELIFYVLIGVLLLFALLRNTFPRYFSDLFRLFFRTTIKQRQIREQLMQTPLPSILLNGFFVLSAGMYLTFMLRHFELDPVGNFWLLFFYCAIGLTAAYLVKFIGLKISGWVFNMRDAADAYIFIVFIVNKMIGILLLPFLVILGLSVGGVYNAALTLSWCLVAGLLLYRFILTYAAVRNQVRVNPFHFFLYLCAFEIAPLLLIYKGLMRFFVQSA